MAYEESIRSITLNSDASLAVLTRVSGSPGATVDNAGNQYRAVKVTGVHTCGLVSAVADVAVGVMQNKPQVTGEAATVAIRGVSKVRMGVAVTAGNKVYLAADGKGATSSASSATYLGVALATGTSADELIPVLLAGI